MGFEVLLFPAQNFISIAFRWERWSGHLFLGHFPLNTQQNYNHVFWMLSSKNVLLWFWESLNSLCSPQQQPHRNCEEEATAYALLITLSEKQWEKWSEILYGMVVTTLLRDTESHFQTQIQDLNSGLQYLKSWERQHHHLQHLFLLPDYLA